MAPFRPAIPASDQTVCLDGLAGEALETALPPVSHLPVRLAQVQRLLVAALPLPVLDVPAALALVAYSQRRTWAAYCSHRSRLLQHLLSTGPP